MFDGSKIGELNENSGPAVMGREPVVFGEERKKAARQVRNKIKELKR